MKKVKCDYCDKKFELRRHNQRYCDKKCRDSYWGKKQYQKNKEKILARLKTKESREKQNAYNQTPARRKYHNEYAKNKRRTDPLWKLKIDIHCRAGKNKLLDNSLKNLEKNLGYTIKELYKYLSNKHGYNESEYLAGKLQLDHIIQFHWYITEKAGDEEFRKCWNMRNLRLIPKEENQKRSTRIYWEEIEKLKISDLLPCGADIIYKRSKIYDPSRGLL